MNAVLNAFLVAILNMSRKAEEAIRKELFMKCLETKRIILEESYSIFIVCL